MLMNTKLSILSIEIDKLLVNYVVFAKKKNSKIRPPLIPLSIVRREPLPGNTLRGGI